MASDSDIYDMPGIIGAYFPPCRFGGSTKPLAAHHLGADFLLPEKCSKCDFSHEGCCIRCSEGKGRPESFVDSLRVFRALALDFGPCGVPDIDDIANREWQDGSICWIPAKCVDCQYLNESLKCNRHWKEYRLPCGLDFGNMTEDRARTLLREKLEEDAEKP